MNRMDKKFEQLREKGRKSLITFVTAGDPNMDTTVQMVLEMERQGADIIELGIPYSDPVAEGPVIQKANERALRNGIRIKDIMDMVAAIRKQSDIPLLYLLYYNCILQYGVKRFFTDCTQAGIDGLIIPDLPFEERGEIDEIANDFPIDIISLVTPISGERIEKISRNAKGYLYCVSSLGVTGVRKEFTTDFANFFKDIDQYTKIPKIIGFGISTPEHVRYLKGFCDGVIVGSAVVKKVEENPGNEVAAVGRYIKELRAALDE